MSTEPKELPSGAFTPDETEPSFEGNPYDAAKEAKRIRLEQDYTNDDLLLEVRRRGLLARVDYHTIVPGRIVQDGYPAESQLRETYQGLANEMVKMHAFNKAPRGAKVEEGYFLEGRSFLGYPKDRKMTIALNYVVEDRK